MGGRAISKGFAAVGLLAAVGLTGLLACGSESGEGSSSGGASGGSSGTFGGDGGSSGSSGSSGNSCATTQKKAEKIPVDMVIGLDTSFSMDFDSKWPNVRDALKSFVNNPAYSDLGVGLQFFPIRKQCSVADYQVPVVPLALRAEVAGPIGAALDAQQMAGGTPMVPLLQGLTNYLVANAKPGRKPIIVLTSDGVPDQPADTCQGPPVPNTLDNAVAVADQALKGTPSIATFVIGVGGELGALNAIAVAGGTNAATLVDVGGNAQAALLAALDGIRRQAIPCDYEIPAGTIDTKATNVTYNSPSGSRNLVYTTNEDGCSRAANGEGWYFDNEGAPKRVVLCKTFCEVVKTDDLGSVDLVFGCPRVDVK
jgi:hypothetical protein